MPYNNSNCPEPLRKLKGSVRRKAMEIANSLMEDENMSENYAISTGISLALSASNTVRNFRRGLGNKVSMQ